MSSCLSLHSPVRGIFSTINLTQNFLRILNGCVYVSSLRDPCSGLIGRIDDPLKMRGGVNRSQRNRRFTFISRTPTVLTYSNTFIFTNHSTVTPPPPPNDLVTGGRRTLRREVPLLRRRVLFILLTMGQDSPLTPGHRDTLIS